MAQPFCRDDQLGLSLLTREQLEKEEQSKIEKTAQQNWSLTPQLKVS